MTSPSTGIDGAASAARSDARELLGGAAGGVAVRVATALLSLATHLLVARLWGAAALGLYSLALAVAHTAALLGRLGTGPAAVRYVATDAAAEPRRIYRQLLVVTLPLSAALGLAILLAAPVIALEVFEQPRLIGPLRALGAAVPMLNWLHAVASCLQGQRRVVISAVLLGLLPPAATVSLLCATAWGGAMAPEVPSYVRAVAIALAAVIAAAVWARLGPRGAAATSRTASLSVARLLRTAWPMFGSSLLLWVLTSTDTFVLGVWRSAEEVGIYRAAAAFALMVSFVQSATQTIAAPQFAAAYWDGDKRRLESLIRLAARTAFVASLAAAGSLVAFSGPLLTLFGPTFVAGRSCLVLLALGLVGSAACGPAGALLDMIGEERFVRFALLLGAAANLTLNLLLVPRWGLIGAAAATAASGLIWTGAASFRAHRKLGYWVGFRW